MLSVGNLSVSFSARPLFTDVNFVVNRGERVALVGKNGAGKTTMLRIIAGEQQPTSGNVALEQDAEVGYLPQVMKITDGRTVIEEAETAFAEILTLKSHIESLNKEISSRTDYDSDEYLKLLEDFSHSSERLTVLGGENYHAEAERALLGLGFKRSDLRRPTSEFSGDWRMRIELAKLLLRRPDLLLLDEPTNHLDIESIRWLEKFLAASGAAVLLVSHDRAFLNNVCNRTMEISVGKLTDYRVGYDEFVRLRRERREAQLRAYENQQKEIADIKDFIERFRYKPTKAVQVQSRIKQLEKIVPIEVDEVDTDCLHLKFPPCQRSGDYPIICQDLSKSYGQHQIFSGVNITLRRGEKVAFVGRNGEGKTTLVKCIMNEVEYSGTLKVGHNVTIGYYAQNQAQTLDENLTVYETIDYAAVGDVRLHIRDILGAFMFGGQNSEKKVKVLSGGERSRLAMISLLLKPVNLLILDEPTNHLDMRSKDILKEALLAYDGTVVLVSHDRDFLDGLVSKVYEFRDGKVREHIGGIYDFLKTSQVADFDEYQANKNISQSKTPSKVSSPGEGRQEYEEKKQQQREIRKIKNNIENKEKHITELENTLQELTMKLQTPQGAADPHLAMEYTHISEQLDHLMQEWELENEKLASTTLI
ncbi:MAG: ABC-F family ATP-binding cassette domain-containing protein [Alloprevotella sp.]|nr:ABC-F family ATP-binding cassette domain-containing protein [Alloprevotella sp.]